MATNHVRARALAAALAIAAGFGVVMARQGGVQVAARDQLNIIVTGSTEWSRKVQIDPEGGFDYPPIGRFKAAGLTTTEIAADLKKRLTGDYLVNPTVQVELEQSASKHFSILGQVKAPGVYPFSGQINLLDALARAGSVTDDASDEALIIRGGAPVAPADPATGVTKLDLFELLSSGNLKNNVVVQDGDTINILPAKPVYITGFVKNQGAFPVRRGMTVQQAIALAGGPSDKGKTSGIKIQRSDVNGKSLPPIDVKDIKTEIVRPGDTIVVPQRIW